MLKSFVEITSWSLENSLSPKNCFYVVFCKVHIFLSLFQAKGLFKLEVANTDADRSIIKKEERIWTPARSVIIKKVSYSVHFLYLICLVVLIKMFQLI